MDKQSKHRTAVLCPRCENTAETACANAAAKASSLYGTVTEGEYEELQKKRERRSWSYSLTEEFIIGTGTDGRFIVDYSAKCGDCGFKHAFRKEEKLVVKAPE